jgi:hypothetical protein
MSGHDDSRDAALNEQPEGLSRRRLVTAGVATGLGVGAAVTPTRSEAAAGTHAASGPTGSTVVEFRARIDQAGITGTAFTGYGYLTNVTHTRRADIFDPGTRNETTALLTAYASGDLKARILDKAVHSLDIVGTMTVYQRAHGGADFTDPASFKVGTPVARYDMILQDILTVFATAQGLPTLTGDMVQTRAKALSGPLAGKNFGQRDSRLRMFATGLGQLIDPVTFKAQLEIAGNWSVE